MFALEGRELVLVRAGSRVVFDGGGVASRRADCRLWACLQLLLSAAGFGEARFECAVCRVHVVAGGAGRFVLLLEAGDDVDHFLFADEGHAGRRFVLVAEGIAGFIGQLVGLTAQLGDLAAEPFFVGGGGPYATAGSRQAFLHLGDDFSQRDGRVGLASEHFGQVAGDDVGQTAEVIHLQIPFALRRSS